MESQRPKPKSSSNSNKIDRVDYEMGQPSKKLCTVTKKYAATKDFLYVCGDLQIDGCPICLKFYPNELTWSCQQCSAYICKNCKEKLVIERCPMCKSFSLRDLSFKEKKLLENVDFLCPKCHCCTKFADNFSVIKHKLECFLEGWKLLKVAGDYDDFEVLVDCIVDHKDRLNNLVDNFDAFTETVVKHTGTDWNVAYGEYIRFASDQVLALQHKDSKNKLCFSCLRSGTAKTEKKEQRNDERDSSMSMSPSRNEDRESSVSRSPGSSLNSEFDFSPPPLSNDDLLSEFYF